MKLACTTLSFRRDLAGAFAEVARLGFEYADIVAIPSFHQGDPAEMAKDPEGQARGIAEALARHNLKPAAFNCTIGNLYDMAPAEIWRREREWAGIAAVMKAVGARTASFYPGHLPQGDPWHEALDGVARAAHTMLAAAREAGVEFVLEAHYDTPVSTPEQVRAIMAQVPDLRFAYDPSHFAMQGLGLAETEFLLDRASHVHLRDGSPAGMSVATGTGIVDFRGLLDALRKRRYAGFLSIEVLPPEADGSADADILAVKQLVEG